MTKLHTNKMTSRRAVAPVIATLLLVAIAVVGGSIIFVFSQGFFSSAQISGNPAIESVKIQGYDATDGPTIQFHDGARTLAADEIGGNSTSDGLSAGEYVAVYLKNDSVNKVTLSEVRVAGAPYSFINVAASNPDYLPQYTTGSSACSTPDAGGDNDIDCTEYTLVIEGDDGSGGSNLGVVTQTSSPELLPGQEGTLVLALEKDVKVGRDMQFKLTTTNGAVFVATVNSGQQSG